METNEQGIFGNVGQKICKFAEIWTILGAIIFILAGIILDIVFEIFGLTIAGVVLAFFNYLSTLTLYAFGQMTEDIHSMRCNTIEEDDEYIDVGTLPEL